jgi:membrane dipeptidase
MAYVPFDAPEFEAARAVQRSIGLVDMHVDTILQKRLFGYDPVKAHGPGRPGQPLFWHADTPRMLEAQYRGVCMGIHYWPWESDSAVGEAMKQIDVLDAICSANAGFARATSAADFARRVREGTPCLIPGVEGAHILGGRLENLDVLAQRGIAYLTLSHFCVNSAATPSMGRGANERDGLTDFGRALVQKLNAMGIVVDVSHMNHPGAMDAIRASSKPVLATHSGARALNDAPRLLREEAVDAIAGTDGAIGVIFAPHFLTGKRDADSNGVLDHIDWLVKRVGVRHVAIGSDYDGWLPAIPRDHRDCRDSVKITHGLLQRGYSETDIAAILRDNVVRVMAASAP